MLNERVSTQNLLSRKSLNLFNQVQKNILNERKTFLLIVFLIISMRKIQFLITILYGKEFYQSIIFS